MSRWHVPIKADIEKETVSSLAHIDQCWLSMNPALARLRTGEAHRGCRKFELLELAPLSYHDALACIESDFTKPLKNSTPTLFRRGTI